MPLSAESALLASEDPQAVARELDRLRKRVRTARGGLIFVSGALAERFQALASAVAQAAGGLPLLIASGAGVLTSQGEIEDRSGAALLVWAGGSSEAVAIEGDSADELALSLSRVLGDRAGRSSPAVIAFVRPHGFGPHALEPLSNARGGAHLFGGGIAGADAVAVVDAEGQLTIAPGGALIVRGLSTPIIKSSPACRLLMPLERITETRGSLVVSIAGQPALDVLSAVGSDLGDQPLVFAALSGEPDPNEPDRAELVLRGVQGVDPVRRALLISDEVREGMRIAFAVRDPTAARSDLEAATRDAQRSLAGAAVRFGIYVNCAGRGSGLYGAHDVDTRILRARFGDLPLAGMMSSFEIAPSRGTPTLQLYTGVLALFSAPS